ncbi:MAG: endolytic transglycosylase MltG [Oscillospiraceae bacterium]|nr:endolytic transglycosylase MltG [Oscillospiraceae bacterium]
MSDNKVPDSGQDDFFVERIDREGNSLYTPPEPEPLPEIPEKEPDSADDFQVDFNFEEEYETPEERQEREKRERAITPRREKRTGCLGGILYFLFVICIALVIACVGWTWSMDVLGLGGSDEAVEVTIPRNASIDDVTDILHDHGLVKYKYLFKLYTHFSSASKNITGGTYQLHEDYDYRALVYGLTPSGSIKIEAEPITIPEGYTLRQIFELLDANEICFQEDLWEAAAEHDFKYEFLDKETLGESDRLEGYLFPDTYNFYITDNPNRVINKFLSNFDKKLTEEYRARAEEMGMSLDDIIIIASMIEKEAANNDERAAIASVIYNRLNSDVTNHYLQIDATIYYAIAGTGQAFSLDYDSPYNTYTNTGLPPGPICNPGIASIKAALYPESTNYYYYGLGTDGVHHFFNSYDSFTNFLNSDDYARS